MRSLAFIALLIAVPLASASINVKSGQEACASEDLKNRALLQNKLAGICESMCREVQAYPSCTCPNFVEPDSTPGVMTWDELLAYMDQLGDWGRDTIKGWHKQASQLQTGRADGSRNGTIIKSAAANGTTKSAAASSSVKRNCTLAGEGISADITTSPTSVPAAGGNWTFSGAGKVKVAHVGCPISANDPLPPANETITNGHASDVKDVVCTGACCISYCCGTGDCFSTL